MADDSDLSGIVIADRYELIRRIGRGSMGAVYEARHTQTRRRCAVKLLNRLELSGDAEMVRRFFREARASGSIESDNVVPAHDCGIDAANRLYYVMDYLQGEDLSHALARVGALNPAVTIKILVQAATGIARAHASGIIHRDLKPANLFLAVGANDEVTVKILDFGVAKVRMELFGESSSALTRAGTLLGTPEYMSPEQLKQASSIDESADVWSLAVVLFECLTGRLPWGNAETVGEMLAAVLTSTVPPVQELAPWVPAGLAKVAHDALQRDVMKRTRSADAFREGMAPGLRGDPRLFVHEIVGPTEAERRVPEQRLALADTLSASDSPVAMSRRASQDGGRSRTAYLVLGAVAVGATAGLAVLARAPGSAEPAHEARPAIPSPTTSATATSLSVPGKRPANGLMQSFMLEIDPPSATVTVDGIDVLVRNGRVSIDGPVGSVHEVRGTHSGRTTSEKVVIAVDGLVPASFAFPPPPTPAKPVVILPKRGREQTTPAPAAGAVPSAASSPPVSTELSQKFE